MSISVAASGIICMSRYTVERLVGDGFLGIKGDRLLDGLDRLGKTVSLCKAWPMAIWASAEDGSSVRRCLIGPRGAGAAPRPAGGPSRARARGSPFSLRRP